MRYKVAPPARSHSFLESARDAIPLVPDSEADCCRAIQTATDVSDRETAQKYLVFLQALGLVAESDRGYYRTRTDHDQAALATAFEKSVFGVDVLVEALNSEPVDTDDAFDAFGLRFPAGSESVTLTGKPSGRSARRICWSGPYCSDSPRKRLTATDSRLKTGKTSETADRYSAGSMSVTVPTPFELPSRKTNFWPSSTR